MTMHEPVPRQNWQFGFSCEFLTVNDILELNVPDLMAEYNFGLFLKMYEEDFDDTFSSLLSKLQELGIYEGFFPWPCLSVDDGYYANEFTYDKFEALVHRIMAWYASNGFPPPPYILVDLEPKMTDTENFKKTDALRAQGRLVLRSTAGLENPETPEDGDQDGLAGEAGNDETPARYEKKGIGWLSMAGRYVDQIDENIDEGPVRGELGQIPVPRRNHARLWHQGLVRRHPLRGR